MLTQEVVLEHPDKPGLLAEVFQALSRRGVETLGLGMEGYEQGGRRWRRLRLLFRDVTEGAASLKHEGYSVRVHPVVYLQVEASVARLDWALTRLHEAGIDVETIYHAWAPGGPGLVIVTSAPKKAAELL